MKSPPKRKTSGAHPAVVEFRKKLESMSGKQLPDLCALNTRIDEQTGKLRRFTLPVQGDEDEVPVEAERPSDPRREDDSEVPVDVVGGKSVQKVSSSTTPSRGRGIEKK